MSRLELGCRALIVGAGPARSARELAHQQRYVGASGILTEGPATNWRGQVVWTISGPEIAARKKRPNPSPHLYETPSAVLARIDDPDVVLEPATEVPIKESVS
jgi:hypothetical protein